MRDCDWAALWSVWSPFSHEHLALHSLFKVQGFRLSDSDRTTLLGPSVAIRESSVTTELPFPHM